MEDVLSAYIIPQKSWRTVVYEGCGALLALGVMAPAGNWLGVFQLIATILMAIVTADNSPPNVWAFGRFVAALNGIITMLSIAYCCFLHGLLLSEIKAEQVIISTAHIGVVD